MAASLALVLPVAAAAAAALRHCSPEAGAAEARPLLAGTMVAVARVTVARVMVAHRRWCVRPDSEQAAAGEQAARTAAARAAGHVQGAGASAAR
jgi:hypothetical protein